MTVPYPLGAQAKLGDSLQPGNETQSLAGFGGIAQERQDCPDTLLAPSFRG